MSRRPSRFSGFNARSVLFWLLAALLATVAVWLAPTRRPPVASQGELVYFEFPDDASIPMDAAGTIDGATAADAGVDQP